MPIRQFRAAADRQGADKKILSLYAHGMTVREIHGHLAELYATDLSPDLISRVTDAVVGEVREWQNRPLDLVYPVVFFDALRVKIRDALHSLAAQDHLDPWQLPKR
jgi:transposase-like protein